MEILQIKHNELSDFINSGAYRQFNKLPISKIRGLSHAKNPRAKPDDLVLTIIIDNNEMQGYLGVLPDDLYFKVNENYQKEHVGWLSCMWVNPDQRGKGIAKKLINTVFDAWEYRILVTEFTPAAKGLYDKTGQFTDLAKPQGLRLYLRFNLHYLLSSKNPDRWLKHGFLLKVSDRILNFFNDLRLKFCRTVKVNFVLSDILDEESWDFIQVSRSSKELMRRNNDDLNWILQNPWIQDGVKETDESKRYEFSSVAEQFNFFSVKLFKNQKLNAVLILSLREGNLKIPYCYYTHESEALVYDFLIYFMLKEKCNMLTLFHEGLHDFMEKRKGPFITKRILTRHYIISKVFTSHLSNNNTFEIQDGDADVAFT